MKKFYWVARENTRYGWTDESAKSFNTEKECYDDMMNAVIEKMRWAHDYDEDFGGEEDANGYYPLNLEIAVREIKLVQHTGEYIYKLVEVEKDKLTTITAIDQLLASTTSDGMFAFSEGTIVMLDYCGNKVEHELVNIYLNPKCVGQITITTKIYRDNVVLNTKDEEIIHDVLMDFSADEIKLVFDEFIFQHLINKI